MSASAPPSVGLEIALLGLLRAHPRHAYELHQLLQEGVEPLGLIWRLKQSNLYALLAKLEEAGYVASTVELHGTRPPRKILRLTPQGREAFAEWVRNPVEHGRDFRLEFLAKLYFAAQAGASTVRDLLSLQRQACAALDRRTADPAGSAAILSDLSSASSLSSASRRARRSCAGSTPASRRSPDEERSLPSSCAVVW